MKKQIIILLVVSLSIMNVFGENWKTIATPEKIKEIVIKNGKTYIASWGGLLIYDNNTQELERILKSDGIGSNKIEDIDFDSQGNIWIGTYDNGIAKFDGSNWTHYAFPSTVSSKFIYSIAVDNDDNLWMATFYGIYKFENDSFIQKTTVKTWCLTKDEAGVIYYASFKPGKIENNIITEYTSCPNFSYDWVVCFHRNNVFYFVSNGAQLNVLENNVWSSYVIDNSLSTAETITDFEIDNTGKIWMISKNNGVFSYQNGIIQEELTGLSLNNNTISRLAFKGSNLIIGGKNEFFEIDNNSFNTIDLRYNELILNYYSKIDIYNGKMLLKTLNEFFEFNPLDFSSNTLPIFSTSLDNTQWVKIKSNYAVEDVFVNANTGEMYRNGTYSQLFDYSFISFSDVLKYRGSLIDSQNRIWISTVNGLVKIENGVHTLYDLSNSVFQSNSFWAIGEDNNGDIWVSSSNEVCSFDGNNWTLHFNANTAAYSLFGPYSKFYFDDNNKMFLNSSGGFFTFDNTGFEKFTEINSDLPSNEINDFIEFEDKFYLATSKGFSIFDGTSFENYDRTNSGLSDNNCRLISKDENDNFWIICFQGISIYNKNGFISSINKIENNNAFNLYPNPSNEKINIENKQEINSYVIYNIIGNVIKSQTNISANKLQIDIQNFEKGLYIIQLKSDSNSYSKSFIKK